MEDDKQLSAIGYMNTPYAYTQAQQGMTLLQQNIMVKVAEHLEPYLKKYFDNPELRNSKDDPKPIMTVADRDAMPPVRLQLSELGVASGSYSRVRDALREVLAAVIETDSVDETGRPVKSLIKVFSQIDTPITDKGTTVRMRMNEDDEELTDVEVDRTRGYVDLYLNKDFIWDIFNMKLGYVSHPRNIARIGKVDNMPLMYYFIRHKMLNFKLSKTQVTLFELRDYLGYVTKDIEGKVVKVKYPRYSQFKDRIISTALNDIKRVCDDGKIDFYFEMREIRPRGKKTGDPSYLEFEKVGSKEVRKPSKEAVQTELAFTGAQIGKRQWNVFLEGYNGVFKDLVSLFDVKDYDGQMLSLETTKSNYQDFLKLIEDNKDVLEGGISLYDLMLRTMYKSFGKKVDMRMSFK